MWLRIAFGFFVLVHGLAHGIWARATLSRRVGLGGPPVRTARVFGLLALAAMAVFAGAAAGIFLAAWWWWIPAAAGLGVSLVVVLAQWNPVGTVSLNALVADGAILAVMAVPWLSERVGLA